MASSSSKNSVFVVTLLLALTFSGLMNSSLAADRQLLSVLRAVPGAIALKRLMRSSHSVIFPNLPPPVNDDVPSTPLTPDIPNSPLNPNTPFNPNIPNAPSTPNANPPLSSFSSPPSSSNSP